RLLVPELAPSLGRLIVPRRGAEPFFPLDDIRERLATRVLELGGAARVAAAQEERAAVLAALSRNAWVDAWEQAVRQAADRVAEGMDRALEHAARQARMPARRWRRLLVTPGERRAMAARLATGGGPLLDALEALDAVAVVDAESHAAWQDALRTVARRLEAAGPAAAQLRVTAVPIGGPAGVDSLVRLGFEVAEVRSVGGRLFAVIVSEPRSEQRLAAVGYLVQPLAVAPTAAIAPADTYRVYRSFDKPVTGIRATLAAWAAADTLIHVDSIGASLEG